MKLRKSGSKLSSLSNHTHFGIPGRILQKLVFLSKQLVAGLLDSTQNENTELCNF